MNKKEKKIKYSAFSKLCTDNGSTLVELMIALGIFAIFIVVAIGGFLQALTNQRLVLKLAAATDNMSLSLEQMMREMRTAENFLTNGTTQIQFERYVDVGGQTVPKIVTYSWDVLPSDTSKHALFRTENDPGGTTGTPIPMTADNVDVSYLSMVASKQNSPGPCRITIDVGVTASDRGLRITDYIQSTVSSRVFTSQCQ